MRENTGLTLGFIYLVFALRMKTLLIELSPRGVISEESANGHTWRNIAVSGLEKRKSS